MCNYVFTNSMKRHERSDLCFKLYTELKEKNRLFPIMQPLRNSVKQKKKEQNSLKPSKEPIYAMKSIIYKGAAIDFIVHKDGYYDIVFNTSPIDAPFVEFIKIEGGLQTKTIIYTQHALDRYNERMHNATYTNHKEIMKRFLVNNPSKSYFSKDFNTGERIEAIHYYNGSYILAGETWPEISGIEGKWFIPQVNESSFSPDITKLTAISIDITDGAATTGSMTVSSISQATYNPVDGTKGSADVMIHSITF